MIASMSLLVTTGRSYAVDSAVKRAHLAGIPVIVAAGNFKRNACLYSPAASPYAISVGESRTVSDSINYRPFVSAMCDLRHTCIVHTYGIVLTVSNMILHGVRGAFYWQCHSLGDILSNAQTEYLASHPHDQHIRMYTLVNLHMQCHYLTANSEHTNLTLSY